MTSVSGNVKKSLKPDPRLPDIIAAYEKGMGLDQLAKSFNLSKSTVRGKLKRAGKYQGTDHQTAPQYFFSNFSSWACSDYYDASTEKRIPTALISEWKGGGALLNFPGTFGGGEVSCPLPEHAYGKRAVVKFTLRSVGQQEARVTFGYRTKTGEQSASFFVAGYQESGFEFASQEVIEAGDLFFLRSGGTFGASLSCSPLSLSFKEPAPPPPTLCLDQWACTDGATVEATKKGWRVTFPEHGSIAVRYEQEEKNVHFSLAGFLISPHAGTLRCMIRDSAGMEDNQVALVWADAGFTLECHKRYSQGPITITLSGDVPHYLDEPLVVLLKDVRITGGERDYQQALPVLLSTNGHIAAES